MLTPSEFEEHCVPEPNSGCWLWLRGMARGGYGKQRMGKKTTTAHRASWMIYKGPIPAGLYVCHRCDVPSCVNPDHLFLGTAYDNVKDRDKKGRGSQGQRHAKLCAELRGEKHGMSKLCEKDIHNIRDLLSKGETLSSIGRRYGVNLSAIHKIKIKKTWAHVS